jgi:pimeloyl-ACP methyl ester carboxylesterase
MSEQVTEQWLTVRERRVRLLSRKRGSRLLLMLHTGAPGSSPFCGSSDLFRDLIDELELDDFRIVAVDLPGAGGTDVQGIGDLLVDGVTTFVRDLVDALTSVDEVHLLAHGEVSLAALKIAREGLAGASVRSCFLVGPNSAAPIGDSIQNIALLHPPVPLYGARSQRWAVRRLAYVPDRVPADVIERMVAHAIGAPHRAARELVADELNASALFGAQLRAQDAFYAYCRDHRYTLPLAVFWGAQDTTASVARGAVLTEVLSGGQAPLQLDLVNQCGHFAQFDRRYQLARSVESFLSRAAANVSQVA